jgi:hypothetical protein
LGANTQHEKTYSVYHDDDALTQITHQSWVQWMKTAFVPGENTWVYNRLINPVNGLNNVFGWKDLLAILLSRCRLTPAFFKTSKNQYENMLQCHSPLEVRALKMIAFS